MGGISKKAVWVEWVMLLVWSIWHESIDLWHGSKIWHAPKVSCGTKFGCTNMESSHPRNMGDNFIGPWVTISFHVYTSGRMAGLVKLCV